MKIRNKIKKIITITTLTAFLLAQAGPVWAIDFPSAPTPPAAPTAPTQPPAPTEPVAPTQPPVPTQSPTPTPKPTRTPDSTTPSPTPTPVSENGTSNTTNGTSDTPDNSTTTASQEPLQGQVLDGGAGDKSIQTGDATNDGSSIVTGNTNLLGNGAAVVGDGASIINSNNADGSINNASGIIDSNNTTVQDNSADVNNGLELQTITGQNSVSSNVGSANIETGDANTTGTMITAVNTNVSGVAVSEFNVVDDHVGDIVIDFNNPANCTIGCGNGSTTVANSGNASDSQNNANLTQNTNDNTFQNNDATVENSMTLNSDSGNNVASKNTMGDNSITTGDANVVATALTFANNNIAGGAIVGIVNIFGNLVGDILLPDFSSIACNNCNQDTKVANTGNASGSTNNASLESNSTDNTFQTNDATLENNIIVSATTGDNSASKNTSGDNNVSTGDANVDVNTLNVVNSNVDGGDFWVVLVNDAGNWLGKILGSPDGANYAGSTGTDFTVDQNGNVTVSNSGNGADSQNNANLTQNNNSTTVQNNNANVVNNINLSANTGGNTADKNVGDSSIQTGDAKIVANIVNFLNNNFSGKGRPIIVLINPFKTWIGDVIPFGFKKPKKDETLHIGSANPTPELAKTQENKEDKKEEKSQTTQQDSNIPTIVITQNPTQNSNKTVGASIAISYAKGDGSKNNTLVAGLSTKDNSKDLKNKTKINSLKINLAWMLLIVPLTIVYFLIRRRILIIKSLKSILF